MMQTKDASKKRSSQSEFEEGREKCLGICEELLSLVISVEFSLLITGFVSRNMWLRFFRRYRKIL